MTEGVSIAVRSQEDVGLDRVAQGPIQHLSVESGAAWKEPMRRTPADDCRRANDEASSVVELIQSEQHQVGEVGG